MLMLVVKLILEAALKVAIVTAEIGAFVVIIAAAIYMTVWGGTPDDVVDDAEVNDLW